MRNYLRTAGVVLILCTLLVVGWLRSAPAPIPAPRTRIALVNLAYVVKHSEKIKTFAAESEKKLKVRRQRMTELQAQVDALDKQVKDAAAKVPPGDSTASNRALSKARRELEDLQDEEKEFTRENDKTMVVFYKEEMAAAQRYAAAHNFELVVHYNDATPDMPEYWHPGNVARKIQAGACIPMYIASDLEISKEVVAALDARWQAEK